MLVATSVPPHTDEAKRHGSTASHPGSAQAARQADRHGHRARRVHGSAIGLSASPPSSTASAAKRQGERTRPGARTAAPNPAPWCGEHRGARPPGAPRPVPPRRSRAPAPMVSTESRRFAHNERREQGVGPSTRCAHGPERPRSVGHAPRGARTASSPTRTSSDSSTTGNPASGPRLLCRPPRRRRRTACRAIRWPSVATPPWTPSAASDQLAAGGVPRVQGPHILAVAGLSGPKPSPRPQ